MTNENQESQEVLDTELESGHDEAHEKNQTIVPFYRRKAFRFLGGAVLIGGAFTAGISMGGPENSNENEAQSEGESDALTEDTPQAPEEEDERSQDEAIETISVLSIVSQWEAEAESVRGPVGEDATHSILDNVTADLLGRIASTAQASSELEARLTSSIQFLHGATYLIESGDSILEVENPIVYGLIYEDGPTVNYSWQADAENRTSYAVFYKENDEWNRFIISNHNDARWFSDRSSQLIGVAYSENGPVIRQGSITQSSVDNPDTPLLISTTEFGAITVPGDPNRFDSVRQAAESIQENPNYSADSLLQITDRINQPRS